MAERTFIRNACPLPCAIAVFVRSNRALIIDIVTIDVEIDYDAGIVSRQKGL